MSIILFLKRKDFHGIYHIVNIQLFWTYDDILITFFKDYNSEESHLDPIKDWISFSPMNFSDLRPYNGIRFKSLTASSGMQFLNWVTKNINDRNDIGEAGTSNSEYNYLSFTGIKVADVDAGKTVFLDTYILKHNLHEKISKLVIDLKTKEIVNINFKSLWSLAIIALKRTDENPELKRCLVEFERNKKEFPLNALFSTSHYLDLMENYQIKFIDNVVNKKSQIKASSAVYVCNKQSSVDLIIRGIKNVTVYAEDFNRFKL